MSRQQGSYYHQLHQMHGYGISSASIVDHHNRHQSYNSPSMPRRSQHYPPTPHPRSNIGRRDYDYIDRRVGGQKSRHPQTPMSRRSPPSALSSRRSRSPSRRMKRRDSPQRHIGGQLYLPRYWPCPRQMDIWTPNDIRVKFQALYVPSTFSHAEVKLDFTVFNRIFPVPNDFTYCIVDKEKDSNGSLANIVSSVSGVDCNSKPDGQLSLRHSVKVMLMATPCAAELIKKCSELAENQDSRQNSCHVTKMIGFLSGFKSSSKSESLGIGGHWCPSLDGPNPDQDPQVLIRTAIRCVKELTGIDLSGCTQWFKFLEIKYLRPELTSITIADDEEASCAPNVSDFIETTSVFMPDVWNMMPDEDKWQQTVSKIEELRTEAEKEATAPKKVDEESNKDAKENRDVEMKPAEDQESGESKPDEVDTTVVDETTDTPKVNESESAEKSGQVPKEFEESDEVIVTVDEVIGDCGDIQDAFDDQKKKAETEKEMVVECPRPGSTFEFAAEPSILVNPSRVAKDGNFNCRMLTLQSLLDYNTSCTKEHSFEQSLFAELFNHFLAKSYAQDIVKALSSIPESEPESETPAESKSCEQTAANEEKLSSSAVAGERGEEQDGKTEEDAMEGRKRKADDETEADSTMSSTKDEEFESPVTKKTLSEPKKIHPNKPFSSTNRQGYSVESTSYRTARPELLMAFSYFDYKNVRLINRRDLYSIIEAMDYCLTRTEISKLVEACCGPVATHFNYRNITDAISDGSPIWTLNTDRTTDFEGRFISKERCSFSEDAKVMNVGGRALQLDTMLRNLDAITVERNDLITKQKLMENTLEEETRLKEAANRKIEKLYKEISALQTDLDEKRRDHVAMKSKCDKFDDRMQRARYSVKRLLVRELGGTLEDENAQRQQQAEPLGENSKDNVKSANGVDEQETVEEKPKDTAATETAEEKAEEDVVMEDAADKHSEDQQPEAVK